MIYKPQKKMNLAVSKFSIICIAIFLFSSAIGRFFFPLGDEPDYWIRSYFLFDFELHPIYSPYRFLQPFLNNINLLSALGCQVESSPLSIWAYIESSCVDSSLNVINRFIVLFCITLPLLLLLVFRNFSVNIYKIFKVKRSAYINYDKRITAMSLTLTFPAIIYYLGLLSIEQFSLLLSFFVFLLWESWLLVFVLVLLFYVDLGNAIVVFLFITFAKVSLYFKNIFSLKIFFIVYSACASIAFALGYRFIDTLSSFSIHHSKLDAIYESMSNSDLIDKYPVIFRPVITYMNFVFSTPTSLKIVPAYLLVGYFIFLSFVKLKKMYVSQLKAKQFQAAVALKGDIILFATGVLTIFTFVFLFPTYANAKYYIFLMPFFISLILNLYSRFSVLIFSQILTLFVYFNLFIFRV